MCSVYSHCGLGCIHWCVSGVQKRWLVVLSFQGSRHVLQCAHKNVAGTLEHTCLLFFICNNQTGVKALWLESNAIREIDNLSHMIDLSALFLHNNRISKIQNLHKLTNLRTLNLSNNCITEVLLVCINVVMRWGQLFHPDLINQCRLAALSPW